MRYNSKFPHGIMFHRFKNSDIKDSGYGALSASDLDRLIKFIGKDRILNPNQWINNIKKNNLSNKDLCLTFDDGLKSQFKVALPVLNKYKIKAFWFIHSNTSKNNYDKSEIYSILIVKKFKKYENFTQKFLEYLEINENLFKSKSFQKYFNSEKKLYKFFSKNEIKYKYLRDIYFERIKFEKLMDNFFKSYGLKIKSFYKNTWMSKNDIKNLSKEGHLVGMHSFSHPFRMSALTNKKQFNEYYKNYKYLEKITKLKPISMSHPLDSYNRTSLNILKKLGILCGFRSHTKTNKGKKINPSKLEIAREDPSNILKLLRN